MGRRITEKKIYCYSFELVQQLMHFISRSAVKVQLHVIGGPRSHHLRNQEVFTTMVVCSSHQNKHSWIETTEIKQLTCAAVHYICLKNFSLYSQSTKTLTKTIPTNSHFTITPNQLLNASQYTYEHHNYFGCQTLLTDQKREIHFVQTMERRKEKRDSLGSQIVGNKKKTLPARYTKISFYLRNTP